MPRAKIRNAQNRTIGTAGSRALPVSDFIPGQIYLGLSIRTTAIFGENIGTYPDQYHGSSMRGDKRR